MTGEHPAPSYVYVGFEECGCVPFAVVEEPSHQQDTFRDVNTFLRTPGHRIKRMTLKAGRSVLMTRCKEHKGQPWGKHPKPKKTAPQGALL